MTVRDDQRCCVVVGQEWFDGFYRRVQERDGYALVRFKSPNEHVKVGGHQWIFARKV